MNIHVSSRSGNRSEIGLEVDELVMGKVGSIKRPSAKKLSILIDGSANMVDVGRIIPRSEMNIGSEGIKSFFDNVNPRDDANLKVVLKKSSDGLVIIVDGFIHGEFGGNNWYIDAIPIITRNNLDVVHGLAIIIMDGFGESTGGNDDPSAIFKTFFGIGIVVNEMNNSRTIYNLYRGGSAEEKNISDESADLFRSLQLARKSDDANDGH